MSVSSPGPQPEGAGASTCRIAARATSPLATSRGRAGHEPSSQHLPDRGQWLTARGGDRADPCRGRGLWQHLPDRGRAAAHFATPGPQATTPVNAAWANGGPRGEWQHLPDRGQAADAYRTFHDQVEKSTADAIPEDFSGMTSPSPALADAEYTVHRTGTLSQGPAGTGLHQSQLFPRRRSWRLPESGLSGATSLTALLPPPTAVPPVACGHRPAFDSCIPSQTG